jgi:hypothetical protein
MFSRPRPGEAPSALREVVVAWVLAGLMLSVLALLPARDVEGPAESSTPARVMAHPHRSHLVPADNKDRDPLGPCDVDARDAEPVQSAHARGVTPPPAPDDGNESDDC